MRYLYMIVGIIHLHNVPLLSGNETLQRKSISRDLFSLLRKMSYKGIIILTGRIIVSDLE